MIVLQIVGVAAGVGLLLLLAAPLVIAAAPFLICMHCAGKLECRRPQAAEPAPEGESSKQEAEATPAANEEVTREL